jgi:hypothetical protein
VSHALCYNQLAFNASPFDTSYPAELSHRPSLWVNHAPHSTCYPFYSDKSCNTTAVPSLACQLSHRMARSSYPCVLLVSHALCYNQLAFNTSPFDTSYPAELSHRPSLWVNHAPPSTSRSFYSDKSCNTTAVPSLACQLSHRMARSSYPCVL